MPKIDIESVPEHKGSGYPHPFHLKAGERVRQRLGDTGGLLSAIGTAMKMSLSGCCRDK
jgi:uncharacterized cupin superfamily protein